MIRVRIGVAKMWSSALMSSSIPASYTVAWLGRLVWTWSPADRYYYGGHDESVGGKLEEWRVSEGG